MRNSPARLALLFLLLGFVAGGCTPWRSVTEPPRPAPLGCPPEFPYAQGWLGGDAAYSVPLSATATLWLFGDTFVGQEGDVNREGSHFIHNSVAVSSCRDGDWHIDYFWGTTANGGPDAFLRGDDDGHWWWLFGGFRHRRALYLGLLEVEPAEGQGALALPFRPVGMRLARVDDPERSPPEWRTTILPLWDSAAALPGSALVVHEDWLYLFTFLQKPDATSPRVLARLPLQALERQTQSLPEVLQYLSRDGSWRPGLDPADAKVLMADNATEMSVVWHADQQRWLALYSHPNVNGAFAERGPSESVFLRSAPALEGPWSEPSPLLQVPELSRAGRNDGGPTTICYAAKEHAQFSRPGSITFTYVCNLVTARGGDPLETWRQLLDDMKLYRPRGVTLPLPEAP